MNRLRYEKSPYLIQHSKNPVDWYPWSEEAFEKARKENRPVFLSIGYSTCHWCHVMEKESFEDGEVALLLNKHFISIKVDREERPDIDSVYMTVCQAMTGRGGWPLSVFMTPDKEPFLAATYIPKENRFGVVGMKELIPRIADIWHSRRDDLLNEAGRVRDGLEGIIRKASGDIPGEDTIEHAFAQLTENYDPEYGGFSKRPKFPTPHNLMLLLRFWKRQENEKALEMVTSTLKHMRLGGIFDQIGGGFHRYSTDERWLLPHFEKMLYDQAMLMLVYSEAFQITRDRDFADTVHRIVKYLDRDMVSGDGAFYSAWDADSEGEEGKFYIWSKREIIYALGAEEGELYCTIYNISDEGNFREEASGERTGSNIPYLRKHLNVLAHEMNVPAEEVESFVLRSNDKLFNVRKKRVHPHVDDKILTDWNGLVIAALAKAYKVFGDYSCLDMAVNAYRFIQRHLVDSSGGLLHRWRDGEGSIPGFLDDYAFLIFGLLELYEASLDPSYLKDAACFCDDMIRMFSSDDGGFYFTGDSAEPILVRNREDYDGAYPSGNSVAALDLLKLSRYTGIKKYEDHAEHLFRGFSGDVKDSPVAHTFLVSALSFALGDSSEIVVAGTEGSDETNTMITKIRETFAPDSIFLFRPTKDPSRIVEVAPFVEGLEPVDGKTTAFVCRGFACSMPTTDPDEAIKLL